MQERDSRTKKPVFAGRMKALGLSAALAFVISVPGCSGPDVIRDEALHVPQAPLLWPSPPEPAKITYSRAIRRPNDIGAGKGFFRKLAEIVLGPRADDILKPYGVTVDASGRLIVADTAFKRVHIYDIDKQSYTFMDKAGKEEFVSPIGTAADAEGNIYVTDSLAGKVFVFSPKGKFLYGFEAGKRPTGIAINRQERKLYVSDTGSHSVNVYDLRGKALKTIGKWGSGNGEFNYPVDMAIDGNGEVLVVDSMNFRVQIFDKEGRFLSSFGKHGDGTGDFGRPKGIAVDRDGNIYVADALFDTVQIFDKKGNFLLNFGSLGRTAGRFWLPSGIFIDKGSRIYVGDSYNGRVQVFEYLGHG